MIFNVRVLNEEDYDTILLDWWKSWNWDAPQKDAISLLIDTLTNLAKKNGSKYCYALLKHKGLIETYKKLGYISGDSYTQEMIKKI